MDEIKPTYVTFEQAELLKNKGFNVFCNFRYTDFNGVIELEENASEIFPYAPEQWQVVEWLRVKNGIWVSVRLNNTKDKWMYFLQNIKTKELIQNIKDGFNSPQQAYSAAFDYILKNLI